MALGTSKISTTAASGMAAATSRAATASRSSVSASRSSSIDSANMAMQVGVNDEAIMQFRDDAQLNPDGRRQQRDRDSRFPSLLTSTTSGFGLDMMEEQQQDSSSSPVFLTVLQRGIGTYENNMRITSPSVAKPGSTMNYLF